MPSKTNSVRLKFPVGLARPTEAEIVGFLVKNEVDGRSVTALYPDIQMKCYYVKFVETTAAEALIAKTGYEAVFEYSNKVKTSVQISDANEDLRYVRIFEVAPKTADDHVRAAFAKYGEIKQITWEMSKPVPGFEFYNGVRGVHIAMTSEIPDLVDVAGQAKRVTYLGMTERCFRCKKIGHKRFQCPLNVPRKGDGGSRGQVGPTFDMDNDFPAFPKHVVKVTKKRNGDKEAVMSDTSYDSEIEKIDNATGMTPIVLVTKLPTGIRVNEMSKKDNRNSRGRDKKQTVNSVSSDTTDGTVDVVAEMAKAQREKFRSRSNRKEGEDGEQSAKKPIRSRSNSAKSQSSK